MDADLPELLEDLCSKLGERLKKDGYNPADAKKLAKMAVDVVRREWGGQQIYVPKGTAYELSERDLKIYERFNGSNYHDLVREFDLSENRIRTIVQQVRRYYRERMQTNIFQVIKPAAHPATDKPAD